ARCRASAIKARWPEMLFRYAVRHLSSWQDASAGGHFAGFDVAPQRDQQLACHCHDHDLADAALGTAGAFVEPAAERAVRLEAQPAPGQLHHDPAHPCTAVLADPLLAFHATTVEGCSGQANEVGESTAITEGAAEQLAHQQRRGLLAKAHDPG